MHAISNRQFEQVKDTLLAYYLDNYQSQDLKVYNRARRAKLLLRAFAKNKELEK